MIIACSLPTGFMLGTVALRGSACEGPKHPQIIYGGYGLTYGVSKDAWEAWLKIYGQTPFVTAHIIHAEETEVAIKAWIDQRQEHQSW